MEALGDSLRGVRGSVRLLVDVPYGWPGLDGEVYALPAGHDSVPDLDRMPRVDWEPDASGTMRFGLPHAGPWDVYLKCPWATAFAFDVRADASEVTDVRLTWPALAPLILEIPADVPTPLRGGEVEITISDAREMTLHDYRGRNQDGCVEAEIRVPYGTAGRTPSLPTGRTYALHTVFYDADGGYASSALPKHHQGLELTPSRVAHTGRVTHELDIAEAALLDFMPWPTTAPPAHWGTWLPRLDVHITASDGSVYEAGGTLRPKLRVQWATVVRVVPGTMVVRWSGHGLHGSKRTITIDAGERKRLTPLIEYTPSAAPPPPKRGTRVVPVAGSSEGRVTIAAMLTTDDGFVTAWDHDIAIEDGALELRRAYARSTSISIYRGMTEASWPVRLTVPRPKPLRLLPAGHLVLVPEVAVDSELGGLWIERADGGPIVSSRLSSGRLTAGSVERSLAVLPGDILGPLPEGEHVFRVRLGTRRLEDIKATVRAGKIDVLRITW